MKIKIASPQTLLNSTKKIENLFVVFRIEDFGGFFFMVVVQLGR